MSDESEFAAASDKFVKASPSPVGGYANDITDSSDDDSEVVTPGKLTQYNLYKAGYSATTSTVNSLPAGCYDINQDSNATYAEPSQKSNGILHDLPDMKSNDVIKIVENFWASEDDYKLGNEFVIGGQRFKAGIMLYGPPGSGKSSVIKILSNKLVEKGGVVFFASSHPAVVTKWLDDFSRVEKDRKCIVILEDIDSLIENYGEARYLEMLDSAKTIDNTLFIATTNYPEKLDPRIYSRPGRFSHVVKIGLPTADARRAFLKATLKNHKDVEKIIAGTDNFTIDHLNSLINSCYREKKDLDEQIERLRSLFKVPKSDDGRPSVGIGSV
jgi:energy-coupling factor transporter ATP-binding protein EcfA2